MPELCEHRGHFTISVSDEAYTKELKNFPLVYHVRNVATDVVEFEAVHYFNCLRYVHDACVQEAAWDKQLDQTLVQLADEMDEELEFEFSEGEDALVLPESLDSLPEDGDDDDPLHAG